MEKFEINNNKLTNFKNMDAVDADIYGRYNHVKSINPYKCYFIVSYPDGKIFKGNNLFETYWDKVQNGFCDLKYILSTGHIIEIPKGRAVKPLIEVSIGMDGSKIFHFINVNVLMENEVVIYKIVLRQDSISPCCIGDIIMSRDKLPEIFDGGWKFTNYN